MKNLLPIPFIYIIVCFLGLNLGNALAQTDIHPDVKRLLAQTSAPEGVVFDIETLDVDALTHLGPYVKQQIALIRQAYPQTDIAVVTHGAEEFALQKQAASQNNQLHSLFNNLVKDAGVSVHVCGAVGGLKGLTKEDFPAFVSYSDSGMAQLNDYKSLGYFVINIQQLSTQQRDALFKEPQRYIP